MILFLDIKSATQLKVAFCKRFTKFKNFIKLDIPISEIYLVCCRTGKNVIWKFFIENDLI